MSFLLGSGAGFSGDRTDAAEAVVAELIRRGKPAALAFETLGERTLAAAHRAMREDPAQGFEPLIEEFLPPVLRDCVDHGITILGNFGAANPEGACALVKKLAEAAGRPDIAIAQVHGDDIRDRLRSLDLTPWEAERQALPDDSALISANVYLGAKALVEALSLEADIVVTGRVADPALFLAPLMHHFQWRWNDWDRLACGMMAGHLAECGAQVSGGYFADPGLKDVPSLATVGYPIIEVEENGRILVTKPEGSGGLVTEQTVKEQLLYEVHDPANYLTPDVVVDLSNATVRQLGLDCVEVSGIRGKPAPARLKTTVCYDGGWQSEAEISYAGPNALERARLAARVLRERLAFRAPAELRTRFDIIGLASVFDSDDGELQRLAAPANPDGDYRLRLAAEHPERRWVARATQELLALYCAGPAGGGGVRRQFQRRVFTASYLVRRDDVHDYARLFDVRSQNAPPQNAHDQRGATHAAD
ncbi:acyclic terpene utilization AtuA family protein [Halomonas sp. PAMB 3264]|uniref:acyclic terpene utilization AtuA family protein n=1 Tax=Halomonas sp. PAMB 3264 TaxID=3075222 RepID=UPI00289B0DC4|nr:acyclic terpene utilization AtuA family protein [Halomonas sp. PAMB 3264]WNL41251.1 acyclic terpene utilization AtuA family protein [Halomonas sp. PAMB 3264]